MPELPEVESIRRTLEPVLAGRRVAAVDVRSPHCLAAPRDPGAFARALTGRRFARCERRGKYLLLWLDDGGALVVHLRMTGRLVYRPPAAAGAAAGGAGAAAAGDDRHLHLVIRLEGGGELRFGDVRKFGRLWLAAGEGDLPEGIRRLGPDPLGDGFTLARLERALAGGRRSVKAVLLDQEVLAGVGNIYADEALFLAGIHPARPAGAVGAAEAARLLAAVRQVLEEAVARGGTTFSDYRDGLGRPGGYGSTLRVYRREGQPCPRCGTPIAKVRLGGRAARFCPACQR